MSDCDTEEDWAGDVHPDFQDFEYDEPEAQNIMSRGSDEVENPEYGGNVYEEENNWEGYDGRGYYGGDDEEEPPAPPPSQHHQPSMHTSGIPLRTWETLNAAGYSVLSILGKGSFATAMRAKAINLGGREIAIKDILKSCPPGASPEQVASQQQYLQQFLPRELSLIKNLKHEHIIGFYAVLETPNHMFVAMELASNGTVEDKVKEEFGKSERRRGVSEYVAGCWFWQTLLGLQYCHERGIAHRDLKPENLLLNSEFHIKIIDFGFAKTNITKGEVSHTYCGSLSWACIEILMNIPYDPRLADVWAMGLILYFMVYGFNPFRTDSLANLVADASEPVQFPLEPSVHHSFQDIIHDCMVVSQLERKYVEELFRFDPYISRIKADIESRNPGSVLNIPMVPARNSLVRINAVPCGSPAGVPPTQPPPFHEPPVPCDEKPPQKLPSREPPRPSRRPRDGGRHNSRGSGGSHDSRGERRPSRGNTGGRRPSRGSSSGRRPSCGSSSGRRPDSSSSRGSKRGNRNVHSSGSRTRNTGRRSSGTDIQGRKSSRRGSRRA